MSSAYGILRLLIFMTMILAAVWGMKIYRNAVNGMTKFQKISNALVAAGLLILLVMLVFPMISR